MTPDIILKPDAGYDVGFGHAFRLLALADYLQERFYCQFHCRPIPPELKKVFYRRRADFLEFRDEREQLEWLKVNPGRVLVLDGYNFRPSEVTLYRKHCRALVKIDDLFESHPSHDVIVNHSPNATPDKYSNSDQILALGTDYILVRKAFLDNSHCRNTFTPPRRIVICFGASDPSNVTGKVLKALSGSSHIKELHVVSAFRKTTSPKVIFHQLLDEGGMIELLRSCDLTICAPSTVSLEACCLGLPLLVVQTASNQFSIRKGLEKERAAKIVELEDIGELLKSTVESISEDDVKNMISSQRRMIDGRAPSRFLTLFEQL